MKPVLNERKCPAIGKICKVIPACPEASISYIVDNNVPLGGRIVLIMKSVMSAAFVSPNAAA